MDGEINLRALGEESFLQFFPSVDAQRIVEIARNDRASKRSFTEVVGANPLLATRLLRLANFAPGLPQGLSTLSQALSFFGQDHLKSLALGLALFALRADAGTTTVASTEREEIRLEELWEHALCCAIIAGRFAEKIPDVAPLQAFTAGFIHDIGRVLLLQRAREQLQRAAVAAADKHIPLIQAELWTLGTNHVEIGVLWCCKTELPPLLRRVVAQHHQPLDLLSPGMSEEGRVTTVVQAADLLCELHGLGRGGDGLEMPNGFWQGLELDETEWRESLQRIRSEIEPARESFGFSAQAGTGTKQQAIEASGGGGVARSKRLAANSGGAQVIRFPSRVPPPDIAGTKSAPTRLKILVVEDHNSLCDMLSLYFMRYGYHVRTANDGESALGILAKEDIHLVLLDLMLPRMDGFAVLRKIHQQQTDKLPYIIVVSAGASEKDRNKVLDLGANEYMPKPFHLLRLLERIQTVEKYLL